MTDPEGGPPSRLQITRRSTGDLLVLMIAGTICITVLAAGASLTIVAIVQPERDITDTVGALANVINVLVGLLAGFLAGRRQRTNGNGH